MKLGKCCLPQASFEFCLFIGKKVIAKYSVNDLIFWSRNEKDVIDLAVQLHAEGVELKQQNDTVIYLGAHIECHPNTKFLNMSQKGLIKQVLETLGLDVGTLNGKFTPAKGKPLAKHVHGEPTSGDFNYRSVVGMLL